MTVEEYMSNFVELLKHNIREKNTETKTKLDVQLEKAKRQLLNAHREVLITLEPHHKSADDIIISKDTNINEELGTIQNTAVAPVENAPENNNNKGIRVEVMSGPHAGAKFYLDPRSRAPCFLGRSAGKKFTERGISLSSDLEVSTTHGKFELKKGSYFYTDQGSTNGSYYKNVLMEPYQALELVSGMVLTVGTSELKISL